MKNKASNKSWMIVVVALCAWVTLSGGRAMGQSPGGKSVRVAVMDFVTATGSGPEWEALGVGLQSMIVTDLGELPAVQLVERARLKDLTAELKLQQSDAIDKLTASKLGALAGASHLLVGTVTVAGGKMRIDARLFAVQTGDIVLSEKAEGAQTAFFELEKTLVKKVVDTVGVRLNKKERAELGKPETTNLDAFTKFSQGLAYADQKRGPEAIAAMTAAVAADGSFALAVTKLREITAMFPVAPPAPPTPPSQCKVNPLETPQCQPGQTTPPPAPTLLTGTDNRNFGIVVRAGTHEARCTTPCQLHLPAGPAEVEVLSPVQYKQQLTVPEGFRSIRVSGRNNTNLIVGSVLAGTFGAMLVATIVLYTYRPPIDTTGNYSTYEQFAPIPLAIATGVAYPAVHFLLRIGKNEVSVGN